MVETQFSCRVKSVRSDNGPEFILKTFYSSKGIVHQRSCVETPQQNGVVERKHQHIMNTARALLFQSNLPKSLWTYAVAHAVFLINRLPSKAIQNSIPFEKLYGKPPDLSFLKTFGCQCFVSTLTMHRKKLDPRARMGVFLGHRSGTKGYLVYDLDSNNCVVSRNVTFHEHNFPFKTAQVAPDTCITPSQSPDLDFYDFLPTHILEPAPLTSAIPNTDSPTQHTETTNHADPQPYIRKSQRPRKPPSYL